MPMVSPTCLLSEDSKKLADFYEKTLGKKPDMTATFEDPDGNFFQLMPPWKG